MIFKAACPWWPEGFRPLSIVKLDDKSLGLRFACASGERMTMPLQRATFKMLRFQ